MLVEQGQYFNRGSSSPKRMPWGSVFVLLCFLALMVCGLLIGAERALLAGQTSYPHWLANSSVPIRAGVLRDFHDKTCGANDPVEVHFKPTQIVLRCGIWWPHSHTAVLPRNPATERLASEY